MPRHLAMRLRLALVGLMAVATTLVHAAPGSALPFAAQEVAVTDRGVVWVDKGPVLFRGFWSGDATLGGVRDRSPGIASSATAVALSASGEFQASIPPGHLFTIAQLEEPVLHAECPAGWLPASGGEFALAGDALITSGSCGGMEGTGEEESQPLFVRHLPGGEWRVLRWLEGHEPPILAAEGNLLAIGNRLQLGEMRVTVLDLATHRILGRFRAREGQLAFASPRRLVLLASVSCGRAAAATESGKAPTRVRCLAYEGELYSLHGRALAALGRIPAAGQSVSHMRILKYEPLEGGGSALAVRDLRDGRTRRLIGFDEPARTLTAVAFRWPAVVVVETTSIPLSQDEVTCTSGEYRSPSAASLRIFDLARAERYVPSPPPAHLAQPTGCVHRVVPTDGLVRE